MIRCFTVHTDFPNVPRVDIRPDMTYFGNNNLTVTLVWPQFSGETYDVATVPEVVHTSFTMNTSVQLVMLYNTQYNVTVTATLCGNRNTTNYYYTTLHYYYNGKKMHKLCLHACNVHEQLHTCA